LIAAGRAHPLCGDALAFAAAEITTVEGDRHTVAVAGKIPDEALKAFAAPRTFAGLSLDRPRIMGIVNVTPDSFSDGGRYATSDAAIAHGMKGEPRTMQADPRYDWAPGDIYDFLQGRIRACRDAGIAADRIAVDPGIGFGQNDLHIAQVLDHLPLFHALGSAIVFGASRKSFLSRWSAGEGADARLAGSLAAALHAVSQGAQILRVHDVRETSQAIAINGRISHRNL
jgi:dihydropteroate synthase